MVDKVQNPQSKLFHISNDFFGYLKGMDLNEKKSLVLDDYKLIFRFSIGKLMNYISEDTFLLILMQYLNKTQMHRIHQRKVLQKNSSAYYRAVENLLNFSDKSDHLLNIIESSSITNDDEN